MTLGRRMTASPPSLRRTASSHPALRAPYAGDAGNTCPAGAAPCGSGSSSHSNEDSQTGSCDQSPESRHRAGQHIPPGHQPQPVHRRRDRGRIVGAGVHRHVPRPANGQASRSAGSVRSPWTTRVPGTSFPLRPQLKHVTCHPLARACSASARPRYHVPPRMSIRVLTPTPHPIHHLRTGELWQRHGHGPSRVGQLPASRSGAKFGPVDSP